MKTLGISIPTYRRPEYLRRCVDSAVQSAQGRPIRVFIADDAGNDVNREVCRDLQAAYPFVTVVVNPVNLGLDANIQRAADLCDCDFIWLVGEDDSFLPGAVARMHDQLQELDTPFLLANYTYVGEDPSRPIGQALNDEPAGRWSAESFVARHLWVAGFLGACVVRRTEWSRTDPAPYAGTYFTHVGRIAEIAADAGSVQVDLVCSVANRVEGSNDDTFTWKSDSYGVFFGFVRLCETAAQRRPALAAAFRSAGTGLERQYRWRSLRVAMRLRAHHAYDYAQYRKYIRHSDASPMKRLMMMGISVTPPAVFRPLVNAYRALRARRAA
jgi:glycosyltransferase involved in cell wall biosynthesis